LTSCQQVRLPRPRAIWTIQYSTPSERIDRPRIDDPIVGGHGFQLAGPVAPLNAALLLGDRRIPGPADLKQQAEEGVAVFLAAYGRR
jgi:hypothetical protein